MALNVQHALAHAKAARHELFHALGNLRTGISLNDTSELEATLAEQVEDAVSMLRSANACVDQALRILDR